MLTDNQKKIMHDFYSIRPTRVVYDKKQRKKLWDAAKNHESFDIVAVSETCPALFRQIERSHTEQNNIQSAVFSECAYAQTIANMFGLNNFLVYASDSELPEIVRNIISLHHITPRYCYTDDDKKQILLQAGGRGGIDCFLVDVAQKDLFTIEFKEPGAKTSEPDLPKYGEDGKMIITEEFLARYPQFKDMLQEQSNLNFFEMTGNNVHDFTPQSIEKAVANNYGGAAKFAEVICTEDKKGFLVMIPVKDVAKWASVEGEIRPAGRNHTRAWTPIALQNILRKNDAVVKDGQVMIDKSKLELGKERGGGGKLSRYKINPLFFVYIDECTEHNNQVVFALDSVHQLRPTVAGKMFFKKLLYPEVRSYYHKEIDVTA